MVTFAHKMHQALRIGSEISIYSGQNNEKFRAIVVNRDDVRDFVILSTKEDVCDSPPRLHAPRLGEDYVQLGFSAVTQENSPLAVDTGVFTSIEYMPQSRHILGSAGKYGILTSFS